ncbi:PREDICTED: BRISC and BRCA1-A complex member 1-like [Priapulus caudatus]|uniref:BRISC and BRCA1-A complex member 1-like n=1 Tax=Priapulus caudatus TaxID=37621 RepID=A0ABM1EX02_PRICU|nr:PREDICTED: BRISC and BRCA1-A complex member 1-like [Priapulus caudatus]
MSAPIEKIKVPREDDERMAYSVEDTRDDSSLSSCDDQMTEDRQSAQPPFLEPVENADFGFETPCSTTVPVPVATTTSSVVSGDNDIQSKPDEVPPECLRRVSRVKAPLEEESGLLKFDKQIVPPRVNCAEKIVICLDISSEHSQEPFRAKDGSHYEPLTMLKRVIEKYVKLKHRINNEHEFALILITETAHWMYGFTSDVEEMVSMIEGLDPQQTCDSCDLSALFRVIFEHVQLPLVEKPSIVPPPYVVRVVVLYNRSHCMPLFQDGKEVLDMLQRSPYFFTDVIYAHDVPTNDNKCEEVFDALCTLDDIWQTSYLFEVDRNIARLHDTFARLLAHPLQRCHQDACSYLLQPRPSAAAAAADPADPPK